MTQSLHPAPASRDPRAPQVGEEANAGSSCISPPFLTGGDVQSNTVASPRALSSRSTGHRPLRLPRLARGLRTNRGFLSGALLVAAIISGIWGYAGKTSAVLAVLYVIPAVVTSHVAARRMSQLALTRRIALFMPPFIFLLAATLGGVFLLAGRSMAFHVLAVGAGIAFWYVLAEKLVERNSWYRYGLAGDWSGHALPEDPRAVFRKLLPGCSLRGLHGVIVAPPPAGDMRVQSLLRRAALRGVPIFSAARFQERMLGRSNRAVLGATPYEQPIPLKYLMIRRIFDLALVAAVIMPAALVLAISSLLIRIESKGPVIFRQARVGYRRRSFICYKLRTMHVGVPGPGYTLDQDPRVTRVGRVLRRLRIDELPQIINILRGEMSWIGPRPEEIHLAAKYRRNIPDYSYRYCVPPGITGWAAVHQGNVGDIEAASIKLEYDFYYIRNISVWIDLLITLKTFKVIFDGMGNR